MQLTGPEIMPRGDFRGANDWGEEMEKQNTTVKHEDLNNLNIILSLLRELKINLLKLQDSTREKNIDNYN